jgi:hypothetical protein
MSDKHEARVEVLTAEVRVLQVGRRQVTLSVVRQLDWAEAADVVPFGRVRTGDKPPGGVRAISSFGSSQVKSATPIEIVGSTSGVLVRSVSWRTVLTCTGGGDGACPEIQAIDAERRRHVDRSGLPRMSPEYHRLMDKTAAHDVHDWTRYDPDQQTYEKWEALPLIVLAGLR